MRTWLIGVRHGNSLQITTLRYDQLTTGKAEKAGAHARVHRSRHLVDIKRKCQPLLMFSRGAPLRRTFELIVTIAEKIRPSYSVDSWPTTT